MDEILCLLRGIRSKRNDFVSPSLVDDLHLVPSQVSENSFVSFVAFRTNIQAVASVVARQKNNIDCKW